MLKKIYPINDDVSIDQKMRQLLSNLKDENATSLALLDFFGTLSEPIECLRQIPFSSQRKYSGAVYKDETLLMGAIEFLFPNSQENIKEIIRTYTTDGMRVIVLARSMRQMVEYNLPTDLEPLALIVISDCIRSNAKETLEYFDQQGVDIRIISGDSPLTVSLIAERVGVKNAKSYVDASHLKTEKEIDEAISKYTIFGRVSPEQKKQLIIALQKQGHTVGMTGDGVNDVMALKQADCSIAMAEGSEAAKEVSNIVLLDSDFSHLPSVLAEGRKVIHHIQNAASLFLVKTIFSVLVTLMATVSLSQYPFEPIQLTFIGSVAIGIPSFFLTMEKDYTLVKGKFMINVLSKALPGGLSIFFEVLLINIFCRLFHYPHDVCSTLCVLVTTLCTMLVLKNIYPLNSHYRKLIFGMMSVIAVIGLVFFHELFEMVILDPFCFAVLIALGLLAFVLSHYFGLLSLNVLLYLDKKMDNSQNL